MAFLTIAQAASHVGVDRSTISRAIKSGRISATILADGRKGIDPAELERVYPKGRPVAHAHTHQTPKHAPDACTEDIVAELHARIHAQETELERYRNREERLLDLLDRQSKLLIHRPDSSPTPTKSTISKKQVWRDIKTQAKDLKGKKLKKLKLKLMRDPEYAQVDVREMFDKLRKRRKNRKDTEF